MSFIAGSNTDSQGNQIVSASGYPYVNASADAAGRFRTSSQTVLFSWKCDNGLQRSNIMPTSSSNGGNATFSSATSSVGLSITTNSSSTSTLQSQYSLPLSLAQSMIFKGTAVLGAGQTNTNCQVGLFDANNGFFFKLKGTTLNVTIRSKITGSVFDTDIPQGSWNLDTMNGSGMSGININTTNIQTFIVDVHWHTGVIRFGFEIGGTIVYCHQFSNNNSGSNNITTYSNLPLCFELLNTSTPSSSYSTMKAMSCQLLYEGDLDTNNLNPINDCLSNTWSYAAGASGPMAMFKLQSGFTSVGLLIKSFAANLLLYDNTSNFIYQNYISLMLNPTGPTGGSWNNVPNSVLQENATTTGSITGGTTLFQFINANFNGDGPAERSWNQAVSLLDKNTQIWLGSSDVLAIVGVYDATVLGGSGGVSATYYTWHMNWLELI